MSSYIPAPARLSPTTFSHIDASNYLDYVIDFHGGQDAQEKPAHTLSRSAEDQNLNLTYVAGSSINIGNSTHVHSQTKSEEDKQKEKETISAIVGAVLALGFSALSAYTLRGYIDDRDALKTARILNPTRDAEGNSVSYEDKKSEFEFSQIADTHERILSNRLTKSSHITLAAFGLLGSAGALFLGGMYGAHWLITASVVSLVAISAIAIFDWVYRLNDSTTMSVGMLSKVRDLRDQIFGKIPAPPYRQLA